MIDSPFGYLDFFLSFLFCVCFLSLSLSLSISLSFSLSWELNWYTVWWHSIPITFMQLEMSNYKRSQSTAMAIKAITNCSTSTAISNCYITYFKPWRAFDQAGRFKGKTLCLLIMMKTDKEGERWEVIPLKPILEFSIFG